MPLFPPFWFPQATTSHAICHGKKTIFTAFFSLMAACSLAGSAEKPATYQLIEGETKPAAETIEDGEAFNGQAVRQSRDYNPVFRGSLPQNMGDPLTILVRYRGRAIQLKGVKDGKQNELHWHWDSPADWTWASLGTYSREQLGEGIILIAGTPVQGWKCS